MILEFRTPPTYFGAVFAQDLGSEVGLSHPGLRLGPDGKDLTAIFPIPNRKITAAFRLRSSFICFKKPTNSADSASSLLVCALVAVFRRRRQKMKKGGKFKIRCKLQQNRHAQNKRLVFS